jgi:hypothetical protein
MDDLITDYTASGVKLAGMQCGVIYGTREVDTVLLIPMLRVGRNSHTRIV